MVSKCYIIVPHVKLPPYRKFKKIPQKIAKICSPGVDASYRWLDKCLLNVVLWCAMTGSGDNINERNGASSANSGAKLLGTESILRIIRYEHGY